MDINKVTVDTAVIQNNITYNGKTILTYKIEYPEFKSPEYQAPLNAINAYNKKRAIDYKSYLENDLFHLAVKQYKEAIRDNFPTQAFEALFIYKLTYNQRCILSLYFEKYEFTGGAHGNTIRYSQTFNLLEPSRIHLNELFARSVDYHKYIFKDIKAQIEKDPGLYFEDYTKLLVEAFNEYSFYCTPKGIVVYYQHYDIAPYSSGIREFLIPYSKCVLNPETECLPS
ncbi:MAG TPA: DUF3298 and DUF4163 domain-containing protein [Ruminiclostridium sp.]|nr:DUF3298 and DUF4163 domain-containing protein [Ruminiclostridium sp.]